MHKGRRKNQREHMQFLIRVATYSENVSDLKNFLNLEFAMLDPWIYELDLDKDEDLWQKFKKVLQEHPHLVEGHETYKRLQRPDMVEQGYWWYDPKKWK